jgi:rRNA methylase, putative, group 3
MTEKHSEIIYGLHAVRHALQHSPHSVLEMWVQDGRQSAKDIGEILKAAAGSVSLQVVSRQTLDRLTRYGRHQGIAVRVRGGKFSTQDLDTFLTTVTDALPLYLVLDGIQDPHNLGACLRTADAAGVHAVIIPRDRASGVTPTVRKVASGAAEHIAIIAVINIARTLREMQDAGIWVIGTAADAEQSIYQIDLQRPLALVMGAEGKGLRENTRKHCDMLAHIPMVGAAESLNVSVATGICLFEAVRQQRHVSRIS